MFIGFINLTIKIVLEIIFNISAFSFEVAPVIISFSWNGWSGLVLYNIVIFFTPCSYNNVKEVELKYIIFNGCSISLNKILNETLPGFISSYKLSINNSYLSKYVSSFILSYLTILLVFSRPIILLAYL